MALFTDQCFAALSDRPRKSGALEIYCGPFRERRSGFVLSRPRRTGVAELLARGFAMVASHNGACRLGAVLASCVAALALSAQVARADPPEDPHKPDMTKGYCPGGRWGWGNLAVCDGEKYPDGSFWHQWMKSWMTGPQFYYDCVGGDEPLPGPPPRWL